MVKVVEPKLILDVALTNVGRVMKEVELIAFEVVAGITDVKVEVTLSAFNYF